MAFTAADIIERVRSQLIDTAAVQRWTDAELLGYLSDGQRTIVAISPSSAATNYVIPLVAGTRQELAANVHTLLSITRNSNAGGTVAGRAVRVVLREQLDASDPDWHTATPSAVVQNYVYDPTDIAFYVYPPNTGAGYVQAVYAQVPQELTATTDELVVRDGYRTPMFDYVMFRAHSKDGDFAAGQGLAQTYLAAFTSFMGVNADELMKVNPNLQLAPTNLSVEGGAK